MSGDMSTKCKTITKNVKFQIHIFLITNLVVYYMLIICLGVSARLICVDLQTAAVAAAVAAAAVAAVVAEAGTAVAVVAAVVAGTAVAAVAAVCTYFVVSFS